jgi:hypothetical protein
MKKILPLLLTCAVCLLSAGCGNPSTDYSKDNNSEINSGVVDGGNSDTTNNSNSGVVDNGSSNVIGGDSSDTVVGGDSTDTNGNVTEDNTSGNSSNSDNSSGTNSSENNTTSSDDNSTSSDDTSSDNTNSGDESSTDEDEFVNPGDYLGGGQEATYTPSETVSQEGYTAMETSAKAAASEAASGTEIPEGATDINDVKDYKIKTAGNYYVTGELAGKINVKAEGVTIYLNNATISNDKKVIESDYGLIITLIGENTITNSSADGSNAIDVVGDLVINGTGNLAVTATKNAIKGGTITIKDATLDINSQKDGLHAEISAYDKITSAPTFSYDDGGYVFIDGGKIKITAADDGIQADTFVYIKSGTIDITTNGGATKNITETSKNNVDGKGIKAGNIDWGENDTELTSGDYLILIEGGNITINSNDDAIHSNNQVSIRGGTINIATGDDGIHADKLLQIRGGEITITKSYEGIEAAKLEVYDGILDITATDDGINGADGTTTRVGVANSNCHIIISGGYVKVNAEGDGIDSNGSMLISGGYVYVMGPTASNNAALDADGSIIVNGGYLFAAGSLGMVETPASNSGQNVLSFAKSTTIASGTLITLVDSSNNIIFSYTLTKNCQSIIISCPELIKGNTYSLYGGDTLLSTFTVSSTITSIGSSGNINQPGGMPGFGGGFGGGFSGGFGGGRR